MASASLPALPMRPTWRDPTLSVWVGHHSVYLASHDTASPRVATLDDLPAIRAAFGEEASARVKRILTDYA